MLATAELSASQQDALQKLVMRKLVHKEHMADYDKDKKQESNAVSSQNNGQAIRVRA